MIRDFETLARCLIPTRLQLQSLPREVFESHAMVTEFAEKSEHLSTNTAAGIHLERLHKHVCVCTCVVVLL